MSTGGVGSQNLDTRLLRFRSTVGGENAVGLVEDLLAAGRGPDAREVVGKALSGAPLDGDLLLLDGRARFVTGDLLGAQAALLKAARVRPKEKGPFRWLGEVLLKRGDPGRAAKVLERAVAIDGSDRAVQLLFERAQRLANIASTVGEEEAARLAAESYEAPLPPEQQERTVIRADLTEQLASLSRDEKAREESQRVPRDAPLTVAHDAPASDAFYASFEDEPTNLITGGTFKDMALKDMALAGQSAPAAPPPPTPSVKRTLAFGSPAGIPAPRWPEAPVAPPISFEDAPPKRVPTSPGAAHAPMTPPAKRKLPPKDDTFSASEEEIDDALGALGSPLGGHPSPWDGSSDSYEVDLEPEPEPPPRAPPRPPPAALRSPGPPAFAPAPEPAPPVEHDPFADVDARADPFSDFAAGQPPAPAMDIAVGGATAEDVDSVLQMLRSRGLFEPPSGEAVSWANRGEVKQADGGRTKVGLWIGLTWVLAIGLAIGGWFGWQKYVAHREGRAAELVEAATAEAYGGDYRNLVDAERHLREARDLDPRDVDGPTLLLFVHAQRALEDGSFEAGYIRPTIDYATSLDDDEIGGYIDAARAVLAAAEGNQENARERIGEALEARPRDPAILYLAGRLEQRLGGDDALTHLEAAMQGEPTLNAARIALAEARYDEGRAEEALEILGQVLANDEEHIRARLWRAFMTSDSVESAPALAQLEQMEESLADQGAPTDQVVYQLTRSRLLRRQGQVEAAGEAVDNALLAGASEPRLLALVAVEGRRAGRMPRAEQAARTAVIGAPSNPDFRKLLAEIQLARRDGSGALTTLGELSSDDPDVVEMRAQSALLMGSAEALTLAAEGLDAYVEANEEASVSVRALRLRLHTNLGQAEATLPAARELAAEAPGDPAAAIALGEAALRMFDSQTAVQALEQAIAASPDDAETHYLLGRARRMGGDGQGATQSLERALELTPEHTEAKLALAGLLLDLGQYQEADVLYTALTRSARTAGGLSVTVAGRLGRVESLIGLLRLDDAQVQFEQVQAEARETPSARQTQTRLLLARGQAGQAIQRIRPLATGENPSASVLALYGDALLGAAQVGPAGEAYAAAVADDEGSPEGLLGQAEVAVRGENHRDAFEILDRARRVLERRIRPPAMHARMNVLYGRAYQLANRGDEARRAFEQALEVPTASPDAHFFLAETLRAAHDDGATAEYQSYLELAPEGAFAGEARRRVP